MIVAQRRTIPDLLAIVEKHRKLLVLGCGTCVTVCLAGGQREVSIIASALRMAAKLKGLPLEVGEPTIERQCDNVFLEQPADSIKNYDAVLSLGCGAGVQALAERYTGKPVYAGLDRLSSASWRNAESGRKNARPAVPACSTSTAAFVPSPAAPNTCSTAHAAAPVKTTAKWTPPAPARGSSFTSASSQSASSTNSRRPSPPQELASQPVWRLPHDRPGRSPGVIR